MNKEFLISVLKKLIGCFKDADVEDISRVILALQSCPSSIEYIPEESGSTDDSSYSITFSVASATISSVKIVFGYGACNEFLELVGALGLSPELDRSRIRAYVHDVYTTNDGTIKEAIQDILAELGKEEHD